MKCKEQFSKKGAYKQIPIIWNTIHKIPILWLKYEIYAYISQQNIHFTFESLPCTLGFQL